MTSVIISGETTRDVPEVSKMLDDLLKGKITMSRFIKFLNDNNLETKVRCINKDINPSSLVDFVGDTISTVFSIPKRSEHEDIEDNDDEEETKDDECENHDKFWKKTNEEYEEHVKDTVEYAKRLIDDYDDSEEDDIEHTKAVKLFHSLMILGRTYRKRTIKGDREYNIPTFTPENILKFIDSIIGLPTDKIEAALERGKSKYYKMKIYKDFDDFVTSMKDIYGIEDVWNPPKEVPEWFEFVRNMQYRKFYPTEDVLIDESEWNEFKKWKEENNKKSSTSKKIPVSASVKTNKTTVKKSTSKSTKTDREAKLKEFKEYADYILLNSTVEDDAIDLLLSYAANMDERCKNLYEYLVDLKKNNKSAKLIKYLNEKTGNSNIAFVDLID